MSKKVLKNIACVLFAVVMTAALSACGSSGGGSNNTPSVQSVSEIVSGVAATGAPVSGTVYLKDSSDPPNILTTTIKPNGTYSFVVTGLPRLFTLKSKVRTGQVIRLNCIQWQWSPVLPM